MKFFLEQKQIFLLILAGLILVSTSLVYLFTTGNTFRHQPASPVPITKDRQHISPTLPVLPSSITRPFCTIKGRDFQMGVAFPQWGNQAYGEQDTKWLNELPEMQQQTSACWVEIPVLFYQSSLTSPIVIQGASTSSLANFTYGIRLAHRQGLHVFVTPLIQAGGSQSWAGSIHFATDAQEQQWFEGYWQTLKPYVAVATQEKVEQFAIGTEFEWLQEYAPDALWNDLIAKIASLFPGRITYDMNWSSLQAPIRPWMHNTALKMIGISAYLPLIEKPARIDPAQIASLWQKTVKAALDTFAAQLGTPIFISEIGYRNSTDTLYHSWESSSSAPADPVEQAAAYDAALANMLPDQNILGVFFWGWDDTGAFNLRRLPAAKTIQKYYQSSQS